MSLYPKLWSDSPRRQLPSWSRPTLSKRPLNAGTLVRDVPEAAEFEIRKPSRTQHLEKNIIFLKQQHHETLQHLHEEIERLKNENRELNFKLIMCRCGHISRGRSRTGRGRQAPVHGSRETATPGGRDEREDEIRKLRNALGTEKNRNKQLITVIEKKVLDYQKSNSCDSEVGSGESILSPSVAQSSDQLFLSSSSRQPTLEECESMIRQLQHKNGQQTHELMQIKADLRDILYSHKWTPDAYLLARAYVAGEKIDGKPRYIESENALPKVTKKPHDIKIVERAYQRVKEEVTLPALKPKLPATVVAERHRRQQAVRTKLSRSVL